MEWPLYFYVISYLKIITEIVKLGGFGFYIRQVPFLQLINIYVRNIYASDYVWLHIINFLASIGPTTS